MTLAERLRKIVETLAPGCSVSFPVETLREWVSEEEALSGDLDLEQWAKVFDPENPPATQTVRDWFVRGDVPGAYKLQGRKWMAPVESVAAFKQLQWEHYGARPRPRETRSRVLGRGKKPNTSAWEDY